MKTLDISTEKRKQLFKSLNKIAEKEDVVKEMYVIVGGSETKEKVIIILSNLCHRYLEDF